VLLNYRAFDTFGEVVVIFAALAAVMAVLAAPPGERAPDQASSVVGISPVVAFVIRLLAPFIAAFGAWVILKGHVSPGGGFQGGVILGALLVLLSVVLGRDARRPLIAPPLAGWLQATAPLAFAWWRSSGWR
jgi:multicomponent Na+:H+ antiporter subunit B